MKITQEFTTNMGNWIFGSRKGNNPPSIKKMQEKVGERM